MIRVEKLSKAAELELYRDSLKHDYLVISGLLWSGWSFYSIFECLLKSFDGWKNFDTHVILLMFEKWKKNGCSGVN